MKKLRILLLVHDDLVPPASLEGFSDKEVAVWATEYDVLQGLEELGHEIVTLGVGSDLGVIRQAFAEHAPHVAFNLLVHFHGVAVYDMHVVSYLELLKKAYTGCNPRGLMLARDKAISKQILLGHRIRCPKFRVFPVGRSPRKPFKIPYPVVVKSVNEEASLGISQASLVTNDEKLVERVAFMHETFGVDVIVEQYIEGREFYIGVLGHQRLQTLPVWELPFDQLPEGTPHIATEKVKWDLDYQARHKIKTRRADGLSEAEEKRIAHIAKRIYRSLGLTGYARIDLRMNANGDVYVLEANPNPEIKYGEDFAESAHSAGIDYPELLQRILTLGLSYKAEWKQIEA
jgi:D-alanine-D-alanine ligase